MPVTLIDREADQVAAYLFELACRRHGMTQSTAETLWSAFTGLLPYCGLAMAWTETSRLATAGEQERVDTLFDLTDILRDETAGVRADLDDVLARLAALRAETAEPEPTVSEPVRNIPESIPGDAPVIEAPIEVAPEAAHIISAPEPHDDAPAALTGDDGDASGAPQLALDGGSVKPATTPLTVERLSDGGHAPKPPKALAPGQQAVVDAVRAAHGDQAAAERALDGSPGTVYATISQLRKQGRLPADVDAMITARKGGSTRTQQERINAAQDRDTTAHDDFVATREDRARARANANMAQRRGHA